MESDSPGIPSARDGELSAGGNRPGRAAPTLAILPTDEGMALSGEVDLGTWTVLSDALQGVVGSTRDRPDIVLDLAGLSFIDGHGLGLIAGAARKLGPPKRLVLRGARPALLHLAEVLRLDREPGLVIEGHGGNGNR
jgi:anti-anti-sigma factor